MTKLFLFISLIISALVWASPASGYCIVNGVTGTCISTGDCSNQGGSSFPGYCPGPTDIQCCLKNCLNGGWCLDTRDCKTDGGQSHPGYCPGPSNIQCCTWQ
ncbi:hypothetical protein BC938DRAFT_483784 [Jimgerdemannia flammicorona]|uniref:Uncharacterized protein n=1 Tax=Jimgerdemannia flammicorona TaxID=994334 RepID=A0A433QBA4_9FUNG|nr:hypothetical protein BC938DRAFT_483784 [Jimgerdemannia flammicorona]